MPGEVRKFCSGGTRVGGDCNRTEVCAREPRDEELGAVPEVDEHTVPWFHPSLGERRSERRHIGGELGVTTGRNRRCGWFDAPIARYAVRVNGLTDFFLTKLDVLSTWEKIPVCVAYEVDGVRVEELPASQSDFHHAKPIYEYLPGWMCDISKSRIFEDLPANAQSYVKFLEKISGAPMSAIGVGPGRDQTISVRSLI